MLYDTVDGYFPNHHPDPADPNNLQDLIASVRKHDFELRLAFDGDGDRLGVVTPGADIIWPDRQLILFARDILERKPGSTIIYDVKCSRHVGLAIKEAGGIPLMWQTGDRKSTRLNSSHVAISYAVFCLQNKMNNTSR